MPFPPANASTKCWTFFARNLFSQPQTIANPHTVQINANNQVNQIQTADKEKEKEIQKNIIYVAIVICRGPLIILSIFVGSDIHFPCIWIHRLSVAKQIHIIFCFCYKRLDSSDRDKPDFIN